MLRKLLVAFAGYEILRPRPVIAACERIGLENPEEATLRPRALWAARLEGLIVVWLLVRGRRSGGSRVVSALLALAGLALVATPRPVIELSQDRVYENADHLELKPWVTPAARLLGVCYLLVVALSARGSEPESIPDGTGSA